MKADKRQLKQILLNLLTNAVKFTGYGTAVHIHVDVAASGELTSRIKDQGAGIPVEDLERVMEPFTRLASHYTSGVEGRGWDWLSPNAWSRGMGEAFNWSVCLARVRRQLLLFWPAVSKPIVNGGCHG